MLTQSKDLFDEAAMLAGLAVGAWNSPRDLKATINGADLFRPNMQSAERDKLLIRWHDAVSRTLAKAIELNRGIKSNA